MNHLSRMRFGYPYKRRIRFKRRYGLSSKALIILALCALVYAIVAAVLNVYPVIEEVSRTFLEAKSVQIINEAVERSINNIRYEDLVNVAYNENGKITSVSADTSALNGLKSSLTLDILNNIEKTGDEGFTIPIGNLTDIIFLSGVGPHIPFRIVPYGTVDVNFRNSFTSTGINQTRHEIYIDVTAKMNAISAVSKVRGTVSTSVMAAQTVIVGDVPYWYGNQK